MRLETLENDKITEDALLESAMKVPCIDAKRKKRKKSKKEEETETIGGEETVEEPKKKKHIIKPKKVKAKAKAKDKAKGDAEYKCVIPDGFEYDFSSELKEDDIWRNFSSRVWHKSRAKLIELGLDDKTAKAGACQVLATMAKPWFFYEE